MSGRVPHGQEKDIVRIVQAVRDLFAGRSNAVGTVTLTPGATSTVVEALNCGPDSKVFLSPVTANAAAEAAAGTLHVPKATIVKGGFTVVHSANPSTDLEFHFVFLG